MYDQYFDPAWDLDAEETLERAYALGVASVCGDPSDAEYERLKAASPDAYDESLVELAFEEGRAEALDLKAESDADGEEEIWETLVESELAIGSRLEDVDPANLPDALTRSEGDPTTGPPGSLDLPSFLRK